MIIDDLVSGYDVNDDVNVHPLTIGGLKVAPLNSVLEDARTLPPLSSLLTGPLAPLWYEGELCCLFAPTNTGKTVLAMQIAVELSSRYRVMYIDCEMSSRQLAKRYPYAVFPPNFYRAEIDPDAYNGGDISIEEIKQAVTEVGAKIVIVDNITYLCNNAEKGADAGTLMQQLCALKKSVEGLSVLVLAHTPKRSKTAPITGNDLAGSSRLLNFFDSAFALNACTADNRRYIKQIKSRAGEIEYTADNVLTMVIKEDENDGLIFAFEYTAPENSLLVEVTDADRQQQINDAMQLHGQGLTIREIATRLNKSVGTVHSWIKGVK